MNLQIKLINYIFWLSFCYHKRLSGYSPGNRFSILFVILYCSFYIFPGNRKTPETLRFRGILRLDTTLSYDNKSIFRLYYSMIVATRPDPTVRPPSRYQTDVLRCANGDFSCDLWGKIQIFRCVRVVFGDFVIMVLSLNF